MEEAGKEEEDGDGEEEKEEKEKIKKKKDMLKQNVLNEVIQLLEYTFCLLHEALSKGEQLLLCSHRNRLY